MRRAALTTLRELFWRQEAIAQACQHQVVAKLVRLMDDPSDALLCDLFERLSRVLPGNEQAKVTPRVSLSRHRSASVQEEMLHTGGAQRAVQLIAERQNFSLKYHIASVLATVSVDKAHALVMAQNGERQQPLSPDRNANVCRWLACFQPALARRRNERQRCIGACGVGCGGRRQPPTPAARGAARQQQHGALVRLPRCHGEGRLSLRGS